VKTIEGTLTEIVRGVVTEHSSATGIVNAIDERKKIPIDPLDAKSIKLVVNFLHPLVDLLNRDPVRHDRAPTTLYLSLSEVPVSIEIESGNRRWLLAIAIASEPLSVEGRKRLASTVIHLRDEMSQSLMVEWSKRAKLKYLSENGTRVKVIGMIGVNGAQFRSEVVVMNMMIVNVEGNDGIPSVIESVINILHEISCLSDLKLQLAVEDQPTK